MESKVKKGRFFEPGSWKENFAPKKTLMLKLGIFLQTRFFVQLWFSPENNLTKLKFR